MNKRAIPDAWSSFRNGYLNAPNQAHEDAVNQGYLTTQRLFSAARSLCTTEKHAAYLSARQLPTLLPSVVLFNAYMIDAFETAVHSASMPKKACRPSSQAS